MPVVTLSSGRSFEAADGQLLLDAAEAAGIVLPHSCRTGRCGACKCKAVGQTEAILAETSLSEDEQAEGSILTCTRTAIQDTTLYVSDLTGLNLPKVQTLPAKISKLEQLSDDVLRVRLRFPPGREIAFLSGQYADVIGPGGLRRSYSFATAPGESEVEFHIRYVPEGKMSALWFKTARPGDLLRIQAPKGTFVLRANPETDLVLLATGTGIAPVKAMLEEIAARPSGDRPRSVRLYWGGRVEADLYWKPGDLFDWLDYVPVLSRFDSGWVGRRGYIQNALLEDMQDFSSAQVYACGSENMIHAARKIILENTSLAPSDFYSDAFVASN